MIQKLNKEYLLLIGGMVMMFGFFLVKIYTLPPQIPLFYSLPDGDEQIADAFFIFVLPILMGMLVFGNNLILKRFFPANKLVSTIIHYLNIVLIVLVVFIFIKILLLVT